MNTQRGNRWLSMRGITGGVALFAVEALAIAGLVAVTWVVSTLVLALL